jgi:aryl-alcohol dehydrogenase-like predicted oxidoreductase
VQFRRLGKSGLRVSALCLGTMMFGDRTDEAEAGRIVESAREAGVNFIDTADAYAQGESERIVGRLLRTDRERWIVATKVGNTGAPAPEDVDVSRRQVMRAIDGSLERLGTDHVDIYYLHLDDLRTPLEETIGALGELLRSGRIRYWGLSNHRGWRIAEAVLLADRLGVPRPVVCQPYYNAMNRMPEVEIIPACAHFGVGVVPYSPLARGVLTGKYAPGEAPAPETRAGRGDKRMMQTEFRAESLALAQRLKAHAEARGLSAGQFAVGWVLANGYVSSVLAGPRTLGQWTDYLGALEASLGPEDEALVDGLVAPGHPSTPGYSDPRYPPSGRLVAEPRRG